MKQILTVFGYTFADAVKKKSFIISSVILALLILVMCAVPGFISRFTGDGTGGAVPGELPEAADMSKVCYYIDDGKLIEGAAEVLASAFPDAKIIQAAADKAADYKNEIAENADISMILVTEQNGLPFITVTTKDFMSGINVGTAVEALNRTYVSNVLASRGIDSDTINFAQTQLPYVSQIAGDMNMSGYIVGIALTMLIFFAIYFYGYGVSMSIATEKTSRVMETLIVSAKPSRILLGKCIAMGVLGLCQFGGTLLFGAICYKIFIPDDFTLMGMELSLSAFTVGSAILIVVYFILGYSLYSVMNAVCGASVSKIEDLQSAMMPVMLIALVSFYIGYFTAIMGSGGGLLQKIAMYVPFCSPFIMPFKLLNGDVAALDLAISIAGMITAIVIIAYVSIRIYSASVLHYGKKLKLKDAYKTKI